MVSNPLSSLFGKSPIRPMQQHMSVVTECAEQLRVFIDAAIADDWQQAAQVYEEIRNLENKADDLKRKLRLQLPKNLFMPVDRRDLLHLLSTQDSIANRSKDIAGIMLGRKMRIPAPIQKGVVALVGSAIATTQQALKAINELDELLETGFSGQEVTFVEELIAQLDSLEDEADQLEMDIRHKLFAHEAELPPVDVIFLYQVIGTIGEISNLAENVGDRLQQLLAR
jgi:predicted phosphate transport protein (TIGR00153 family)